MALPWSCRSSSTGAGVRLGAWRAHPTFPPSSRSKSGKEGRYAHVELPLLDSRGGALLLTTVLTLSSGAADLWAEKRASGTEHWLGKDITYELAGQTRSDVQFRKGETDCRITVTVDGRERTVTLRDEGVDVDGGRFDLGSYARVSLKAERDFLIVNLVTTRSWGASASGSASSLTASSPSNTASEKTGRSESSGKSTDYRALGFTELSGMPIRFALTGGRSVTCSITPRPGERVIRFDIDEGKNESTIVIKPALVIVDGVTKKTGPVAPFFVTASNNTLKITVDRRDIWSRD